MKGTLYGVGVGPGDPELMTLKAVRMIRENEIIAVPGADVKETVAYKIAVQAVPELEEKELLVVAKILLESRALTKQELYPIIHKLIYLCSNEADMKLLRELIQNEKFHYVELRHGKPLLDSIWKLEQAVKAQQYLEIEYQKLKNHEVVNRKVKPVGVIFSEFYFYLVAYIDGIDKEDRKSVV